MGPRARYRRADGPVATRWGRAMVASVRVEDDEGVKEDGTRAPDAEPGGVAPATPLGPDDDVFTEPSAVPPRGGRARGIVVGLLVLGLALGFVWVVLGARDGGGLGQDPFGRAAPDGRTRSPLRRR